MAFDPKLFEEYDMDIEVDFCGVCGSDLHTLRSGWACDSARDITVQHLWHVLYYQTMHPIVVGP